MKNSATDYSRSFCDPNLATAYEHFYKEGTADEAMWSIEREFLAEFYDRNQSKWPKCSYLDFACGTGRVISFMESKPARSEGMDISAQMLEVARSKVTRSELFCADITRDKAPAEKYDLITAFRFFLNAEPDLRSRVMKALGLLLKNEHSRLVFNNHGNPFSYKMLAWPIHRARQLMSGRQPSGNYMTHGEVTKLIADANLHIVEQTGCGIVSPKLFKLMPSFARKIERGFGCGRLGRTIGVDQIYVVAK